MPWDEKYIRTHVTFPSESGIYTPWFESTFAVISTVIVPFDDSFAGLKVSPKINCATSGCGNL